MSREQKYQALVLKKQPFNEGDEIITFYTREGGKIRALAKAVKFSTSKLQQKLQALFLVDLILTQSRMPKIISVQPLRTFSSLRENLAAVKMSYFAVETILKFTPDEHKNEQLFDLAVEFFKYLDETSEGEVLDLGLLKFKMDILESLGLGVQLEDSQFQGQAGFFNPAKGGFYSRQTGGGLPVTPQAHSLFLSLKPLSFNGLKELKEYEGLADLQYLLSAFIEYQLERPVKSEQYLNGRL
jgi:DNA repair protein RecO (recombination protein O)